MSVKLDIDWIFRDAKMKSIGYRRADMCMNCHSCSIPDFTAGSSARSELTCKRHNINVHPYHVCDYFDGGITFTTGVKQK